MADVSAPLDSHFPALLKGARRTLGILSDVGFQSESHLLRKSKVVLRFSSGLSFLFQDGW